MPSRKTLALLTLALVTTVAVIYFSVSGKEEGTVPKRVLLITLDTTRADRLGCYGYENARTPHLDALARRGVRFKDATSTSPTTLPSHASIFTGLFPPAHGARNNGNYRLVDEVTTLAEVFQKNGFATGAFIAAEVLDSVYGLAQGFDHYADDMTFDALSVTGGDRQQRAEQVVSKTLDWLLPRIEENVFAWVHLFDPHAPYEQHSGFAMDDPYDSEIAYMDAWIGRLFEALESRGALDDTLVVVVADHGESLGEHGEETHGIFCYQATLAVPLLMVVPGRSVPGHVVERPVRTVDLYPTLMELFEFPLPPEIHGRSLLTLLEGREDETERPCYFETLLPRYEYLWSGLAGMRSGMEKFIDAPRDELYDLAQDPRELKNLLEGRRELGKPAQERFSAFLRGLEPIDEKAGLAMSAQSEEAMRALGYTFAGVEVPDKVELPDPKDKVVDAQFHRDVRTAFTEERHEEVLRLTARIVGKETEDLSLGVLRARALLELGKVQEAEPLYRRFLALLPEEPLLNRGMGRIQFATGNLPQALEHYGRAAAVTPMDAVLQAGIGDALMQQGNVEAAVQAWRRALALRPYYPKVLNNLGSIEMRSGKLLQGARTFERVLDVDLGYGPALQNLIRANFALAGKGEWKTVLGFAERGLKRHPAQVYWIFLRARAWQALGLQRNQALRDLQHLRGLKNLPADLAQQLQRG